MALHRDDRRALLDHKLTEPLGWIAFVRNSYTLISTPLVIRHGLCTVSIIEVHTGTKCIC